MTTGWEDILDLGIVPVVEPDPLPEVSDSGPGAFARLRESLSRSRRALGQELSSSFRDRVDDRSWESLEESLILADVGAPVTAEVVGRLEREVEAGAVPTGLGPIRSRLAEILTEVATPEGGIEPIDLEARPAVILVTGVNGTGKTTSIGKLAWTLVNRYGLKVILGAADTYRAAAAEQLEAWADRAGAEIVRSQEGADPGSVAWDAIAAGEARGADVVIIDTAGRLQTQGTLMDELTKVRRVIADRIEGAPHQTLISIDATTGQNGLRQAKAFGEAVPLDGVILTKLDGSAKGGIALAIVSELGLPVKLIGIGEGIEDLRPFDPGDFARALVGEGDDPDR